MSTSINKENVWVFIMAGQSNMAGRGIVEAEDTISDKRIFSINKDGQIIIAKEPIHFYEPRRVRRNDHKSEPDGIEPEQHPR